ncbi:hypothetical protein BHM03_00001614 [Ensete ventricosum]|nr:hypothetical protein BHM03_00001614 [Ensete ventricosum]
MELARWMCFAFKYAEQAFAGPGPCALVRPLHNLFGTERNWSFYSGCCGLFVPNDLTAFMTHHAAAPFAMPVVLVVRRAPAGGGCRPYLCQVGRTVPCYRASRHACRTGDEVCAYT